MSETCTNCGRSLLEVGQLSRTFRMVPAFSKKGHALPIDEPFPASPWLCDDCHAGRVVFFPAGSTILCEHCDAPIFRLKETVKPGDRAMPDLLWPVPPTPLPKLGELIICGHCKKNTRLAKVRPS